MTRRYLTRDRSAPEIKREHFYVKEQLGPKQSLTPEGFLLCEDVPLARPGEMIYGPDETPIRGVNGNPVRITRGLDELFKPETLTSFNGKPVVNEHPDEDVTPKNWKKFCCGILLNVRKGDGDNEGLMVGDLLITEPEAISDVQAGKREVSLGYDADYEEVSPGEGRQTNIIGNHVALVERGRCGPRCAIGDHETVPGKDQQMATATVKGLPSRRRLKVSDALAKLKKVRDEAAEAIEELENGETTDEDGGDEGTQHIHIHMQGSTAPANASVIDEDNYPEDPDQNPDGSLATGAHTEDDPTESRFSALEQGLASLLTAVTAIQQAISGGGAGESQDEDQGAGGDPTGHGEPDGDEPGSAAQAPGNSPMAYDDLPEDLAETMAEETGKTKDAARKVRDSAVLADSYKETLAKCEILVPGFRMPTFDAKAKPVNTLKQICLARKKCLDSVYSTQKGKQLIDSVSTARTFDSSVMSCAQLRGVFVAAAGAQAMLNNQQSITRDSQLKQGFQHTGKVQSIDDLNQYYKQHYGRK